ncbi:MAG: quinone-dependent dihydroorotate dehydrogenase [Betaproteobacteria bacterium]|nr:quinone-dependent dihydroorotate dehydrogenase [Betaproteobacteria bacterium]MDE1981193.1 quinone-dependent dihydroorotate dehydrogenase [Betaproteobacteria bacterium]MDE2131657.1 quinone-dependent dihydroorotate dehydrogenase [Betaproteobacteria bacterium]MDE2211170.1 quinone-dependent dihydroorotate dehydrogenase [Betaproteobacteria bacterium]
MLYSLARNLLFQVDPERAHALSLQALTQAARCGLVQPGSARTVQPRTIMGLQFPNPLGIAAGLDKNAEYLDGLGALGVGFVEVGTVTPRPQPGNPKPRVFRLPEVEGLINRLGFNNNGVDYLLQQVARTRYRGILGINIGKNFDTPLEKAVEDYVLALRRVAPHAHYVTVNISSPNTANLRQLQGHEELDRLLGALKSTQQALADDNGRYVPIALKIAPDLTLEQVDAIARLLVAHRMDAVIATNTTVARQAIASHPLAGETGGLSGAPLHEASLHVVRQLAQALDGALPIIGVGGITNGARAKAMLDAGASLIQVYTGLIYRGPGLIDEILEAIA